MQTVSTEVRVEYFQFVLLDVGSHVHPAAAEYEDVVARPGPTGAVLQSELTDHYPLVRLESRPIEPRRAVPEWGEPADIEILVTAGPLRLTSLMSQSPEADLPVPPGRYRLRAYRRHPGPLPQREASHAHGAEHWLLQLWPA